VTVMNRALVGVLVAGPLDLSSTAVPPTRAPNDTATPATMATTVPVPIPGRAACAGRRDKAAPVT